MADLVHNERVKVRATLFNAAAGSDLQISGIG
jgi:hypothetical protein